MKYIKLFLGALRKSIIPDLIFLFVVFLITETVYQIRSLYKISLFSKIYNGIADILYYIIIVIKDIFEFVFYLIKIYIDFMSKELNIQPYIMTFLLAACFTTLFGIVLYRHIKNVSNIRGK